MGSRLPLTEIQLLLKSITKWKFIPGKDNKLDCIIREYKFKNFEDSWIFLNKVAMRSHKLGHHPKIYNNYNIVEIELTTHDVKGLSEIDFKMAKVFENTANKLM